MDSTTPQYVRCPSIILRWFQTGHCWALKNAQPFVLIFYKNLRIFEIRGEEGLLPPYDPPKKMKMKYLMYLYALISFQGLKTSPWAPRGGSKNYFFFKNITSKTGFFQLWPEKKTKKKRFWSLKFFLQSSWRVYWLDKKQNPKNKMVKKWFLPGLGPLWTAKREESLTWKDKILLHTTFLHECLI